MRVLGAGGFRVPFHDLNSGDVFVDATGLVWLKVEAATDPENRKAGLFNAERLGGPTVRCLFTEDALVTCYPEATLFLVPPS